MPVEVVLEQCHLPTTHWFVVIKGVPYSKGLVITNAHPLPKAERIRAKVEKALREYGAPSPPEPAPPKRSRFDRI
jgi:hypothetical protein